MAKKSGLIPLFTSNYVANIFDDYVDERINREKSILLKVGEEFINNAKKNGEYTDRTGNLRSSIGYILISDGTIISQNITGRNNDGKTRAEEFAKMLASNYKKGLVLVGFAGMEYAAAVESKGYDVISGSAPTKEMMVKAFENFLK